MFFGVWLIAACQQSPTSALKSHTQTQFSTATPQLDPDVEEYAVYAAVLNSKYANKNTKQILIMDQTRVNGPKLLQQDLSFIQENTPLAPELVDSFLERNQQPHPLKPVLDLNLEYQLLTREEVDKLRLLDEASNWKLFYQEYPDTVGFLHLSRVGFNKDLSLALVYLEQYHYEQPIVGSYYLMTRLDGRWEASEIMGWIT
jgi:hypothetical protein